MSLPLCTPRICLKIILSGFFSPYHPQASNLRKPEPLLSSSRLVLALLEPVNWVALSWFVDSFSSRPTFLQSGERQKERKAGAQKKREIEPASKTCISRQQENGGIGTMLHHVLVIHYTAPALFVRDCKRLTPDPCVSFSCFEWRTESSRRVAGTPFERGFVRQGDYFFCFATVSCLTRSVAD